MEQITQIIHKDEGIKYINIIMQYEKWLTMMVLQTKTQKKSSWSSILSIKNLIAGCGKTSVLLNLKNEENEGYYSNIDKVYLYANEQK